MGLYRDETGLTFETDDSVARSHGWTPVGAAGEESLITQDAAAAREKDLASKRGVLGDINAAGTGFLSGATLGGSDYVLGNVLTDNEREQLLSEMGAHPYLHEGGEALGMLGSALAAPGSLASRTPTGYLAATAGHAVEGALAEGGVAGTAKALGYMGAEGAIQSGGSYLGSAALEDKDATAEGLAGALGTGFAFGAGGGAALLGVTKGTIAARKLYSRVLEGGEDAAKVAETAWSLKSQAQLEADTATADIAKTRLEEIRQAKVEALKATQQSKSMLADERLRASEAPPQEEYVSPPPEMMRTPDGTQIIPRPMSKDQMGFGEPAAEAPVAAAEGGTQVIPRERTSLPEGAGPDYSVPERIGKAPREAKGEFGPGYMGEGPMLKDKLAGDIRNSRIANEAAAKTAEEGDKSIEGWLNDIADHDATEKAVSSVDTLKKPTVDMRTREMLERVYPGKTATEYERLAAEARANRQARAPHGATPRQEPGLPARADNVVDGTVSTVPSSLIKEHGFESLSVPGRDAVKTAKGRAAILEGQRDPIVINVSPGGKYHIEDGTHRLAAAIELDKPIKVKWYRGAKGLDEGAGTLEGQLNEMKSRADLGQSLSEMRMKKTTELLGKSIASEEAKLIEALEEFEANKKSFVEIAARGSADERFTEPSDFPKDFLKKPKGKPMNAAEAGFLADVNAESVAGQKTGNGKRRGAAAILDDAHEAALERIKHADTPAERGQAVREADQFERMLEHLSPENVQRRPVPDEFAAEVHAKAEAIGKYEKSSAKLAEAVGDKAHPGSKAAAEAYHEAENEAVRKQSDRAARAVDDRETFGPHEEYGPRAASPKERVQYAKARHNENTRAYDQVSNDHAAAEHDYKQAKLKVAEGEKAKKVAGKIDAKAAKAAEKAAREPKGASAMVQTLAGVNEMVDIPGMPKVSDLPVVGPLIGAYLKYRLVRKAMGRGVGRVPALADNRVAALAARTKDRMGRAIDRSLGLMERAAGPARKVMPLATGVLAARIFDDGHEPPPKGASVPELVAARTSELAAYVTTPNAIENDVRRELRNVMDPDLIAAAEKHRRATMQYLLDNAPKPPATGPLQKAKYLPPPADAMSWARRFMAVNDIAGVYESLADKNGHVSLEAADVLRVLNPKLYELGQQRLLERAGEAGNVPYRQRVQLSLVFKLPLDAALSPDNLKVSATVYDRTKPLAPPPGGAPPPAPPVPSVAQPTNLTSLFQNPSDKSR